MKKRRGSILLDFLLVTVAVFSALIMFLNALNSVSKKSLILEQNSTQAKIISQSLLNLAKNAILFYNVNNFEKNANFLLDKNRHIHEISVFRLTSENEYTIIYSNLKNHQGNIVRNENIREKLGKIEKGYLEGQSTIDEKSIYKYMQIIKDGDKVRGILNIVLDLDAAKQRESKGYLINVLITLISIIFITIFTSAMLYFRIYHPITDLIKEVNKIKSGQIGHRLKITVNNEISKLADAIENMKNSIWENSLDHRLANPITGLQGVIAFSELINDKLSTDEHFGILSVGLKNIKPFFISEGIVRNEELQRFILDLISKVIDKNKVDSYKMFQLTEHQFVVVLPSDKVEKVGEGIKKELNKNIKKLYKDEIEQVEIQSEEGEKISYPLIVAIIIGFTTSVRGEIQSYKDVEDKIIDFEKRYYNVNDKNIFVMADLETAKEAKKPEKENKSLEEDIGAAEEELDLDDTDNLLDGLEDIGEDTTEL